MASIDLRGVLASIDIRSAELVKFGNLCGAPTPTTWSYLTPSGNRVVLGGTDCALTRAATRSPAR